MGFLKQKEKIDWNPETDDGLKTSKEFYIRFKDELETAERESGVELTIRPPGSPIEIKETDADGRVTTKRDRIEEDQVGIKIRGTADQRKAFWQAFDRLRGSDKPPKAR